MDCLTQNPVHVLITENNLQRWHWRRALNDLRRMAQPPQLIVTSRTADDHLWAEVLNIGGFDVLAQPLERDEVERVVSSARRHFDLPARGDVAGRRAACLQRRLKAVSQTKKALLKGAIRTSATPLSWVSF